MHRSFRRRTAWRLTLWGLALLSGGVHARALPASMTLVTVNGRPAAGQAPIEQRGISVSVYNLDALNNLLKNIKAAVPPHLRQLPKPTAAQRAEIEAVLKAAAKTLIPRRAGSIMLPQLAAQRWGIDKVPAVIFDDGDSVIYGVTDLSEALTLWLQQQAAEP